MDILQLVNSKLTKFGITRTDAEITNVLEEVDQCIKNYCHIHIIPKELMFVEVNMCVDYIRFEQENIPVNDDMDTNTTKKVGRLKVIAAGAVNGGTRYEFYNKSDTKSDLVNAHTIDLDSLLTNYIAQLNTFRRNVW